MPTGCMGGMPGTSFFILLTTITIQTERFLRQTLQVGFDFSHEHVVETPDAHGEEY